MNLSFGMLIAFLDEQKYENPPQSPFEKGGRKIFPPLKRGDRGDFEIKGISY